MVWSEARAFTVKKTAVFLFSCGSLRGDFYNFVFNLFLQGESVFSSVKKNV